MKNFVGLRIFFTFAASFAKEVERFSSLLIGTKFSHTLLWQKKIKSVAFSFLMKYKTRKIQFNENLIEQAIDEKWVKSLAFFGHCKLLFHHATIFNYSHRRLATLLKCSHNKVKYHMDILRKIDLVLEIKGNLTFKNIIHKHKCSVIINETDTLTDIENKLYLKIIEKNARQQKRVISEKAEARLFVCPKAYLTIRQIKRITRNINSGMLEKPYNSDITFSQKGISQLLNISENRANSFKRFTERNGLAKFTRNRKLLFKTSLKAFENSFDLLVKQFGCVFFSKGFVVQSLPCTVTLNENYYKQIK